MGFKKIIPSSEYYLLNDELSESMIPHPEDPVRDISKNYWKNNENGEPIKNIVPSNSEENKIYLDEEKDFYTPVQSITEYVKIFHYEAFNRLFHTGLKRIEKITLMIARLF